MAINIGHISDESIDEYLDGIDLEKILAKFDLIESDYETINFESQSRAIDASSAVLPTGEEFVEITNEKYNQSVEITHDYNNQNSYGDAA